MNLVNFMQFFEPVQEHVTRVYSTASEIITVLLVLWCINFVGGMIHRTFMTGRAFGNFYRSYLDENLKKFLGRILNLVRRRTFDEEKILNEKIRTRQAAL